MQKIKQLLAIKESPQDYLRVERAVLDILRRTIYLPLVEELREKPGALQNAGDDWLQALHRGKIYFSKGGFFGKFTVSISKQLKALGAVWDKETSSWRIREDKLPIEAQIAISTSRVRFEEAMQRIDEKLATKLPPEISDLLKIKKFFDSSLWDMAARVDKSLKGIVVPPQMNPERAKVISSEYTLNMDRYIKDFTDAETAKLRARIQEHVLAGNRHEDIVDEIQKSYSVSQNKAKFLARQESSLMLTSFKQARYLEAGVREYIWGCVAGSKLHPVRPMHDALKGKTFSWENPPVTNNKGQRNNPGQDFNCRCFAKPVVKFNE